MSKDKLPKETTDQTAAETQMKIADQIMREDEEALRKLAISERPRKSAERY